MPTLAWACSVTDRLSVALVFGSFYHESMNRSLVTTVPPARTRIRFRFRFGLCSLFFALTFAALSMHWVSEQAEIVRERRAALEAFRASGGIAESDQTLLPYWLPWYRRWLGDEDVNLDFHVRAHDPALPSLQRLFPESFFYLMSDDRQSAGIVVPKWHENRISSTDSSVAPFWIALILLYFMVLGIPTLTLGCYLNWSAKSQMKQSKDNVSGSSDRLNKLESI